MLVVVELGHGCLHGSGEGSRRSTEQGVHNQDGEGLPEEPVTGWIPARGQQWESISSGGSSMNRGAKA